MVITIKMKRAIIFLALAALASSANAQTFVNLKGQEAAQKPVTISAKNMPVDDAVSILSKQSGLRLNVSVPFRDLKVTLFVKNQPAGLILDKLADVLDCRWDSQANIYFLVRPRDEDRKIDAFLAAEDAEWRSGAQSDAEKLANAATGSYSDFLQTMGKSIDDAAAQGNPGPDPNLGGRRRMGPMHEPLLNRTNMESYAAGQLYRTLSDSAVSDLWAGQVLQTYLPGSDQSRGHGPLLLIRYDAYGSHDLEMLVPPQPALERPFMVPTNLAPTTSLAQLPFGKELEAWPNLSAADDDVLNLPIQQNRPFGRPPASDEEYQPYMIQRMGSQPTLSMADQLQELAEKSGVTVVADGFRTAIEPNKRPVAGADVKGWLNSLVKTYGDYVKVEDGVVMARHGGFWRLRQYEIPESAFAPLEKKKELTLDDYIGFASQLSDAQAESLRSINPPVTAFSTEVIRNALPALRFVAALGQTPASGVAVPYEAMNEGLRTQFVNAVEQALFWGGNWKGSGLGADPRRYGFVLTIADVQDIRGLAPGTDFLFGSSKDNGAEYQAITRN